MNQYRVDVLCHDQNERLSFRDLILIFAYLIAVVIIQFNIIIGIAVIVSIMLYTSESTSLFLCVTAVLFEPYFPLIGGLTLTSIISILFIVKYIWFIKIKKNIVTIMLYGFFILFIFGIVKAFMSDVKNPVDAISIIALFIKLFVGILIYSLASQKYILKKCSTIFILCMPIILLLVFVLFIENSFLPHEFSSYVRYYVNNIKPGNYSIILAYFTIFAIYTVFNAKGLVFKAIGISALFLTFVAVLRMASKSGLITFIMAVIICVFVFNKGFWVKIIVSLSIVTSVFIVILLVNPVLVQSILYRFGFGDIAYYEPLVESQRYLVIIHFPEILSHYSIWNVFLGNGLSNKIEAEIVNVYTGFNNVIHNLFLHTFFQLGFLGLVDIIGVSWVAIKNFNKNIYSSIFKVGFLVILVGSMFSPIQSSEILWMSLGLALAKTTSNLEVLE